MTAEFQPNLIRSINEKLALQLKQEGRVVTFAQETTLFYEDHVPIVAYLLLEGHVKLLKKKKVFQESNPTIIIGLEHLMYNKASPCSVVATKDSSIIFLDRSSLLSTNHKQLKT